MSEGGLNFREWFFQIYTLHHLLSLGTMTTLATSAILVLGNHELSIEDAISYRNKITTNYSLELNSSNIVS